MIDIIIPIYNSNNTLDSTLYSILTQKNVPNMNIYIIDDNSKEDCSLILKKYLNKLNIAYKKLSENKGAGFARNQGLKISNSKYIIFLDSDDVFADSLSINKLYSAISDSKCDVVRSVIKEEQNKEYKEWKNENIGLHGKIYNRDFLLKYNIHFNETRSNEDTGFNLLVKLCGARYFDINDTTYIWKNNSKSITRKNKAEYKNTDALFFAYNLFWAINEAEKRYCNFLDISFESIIAIINLYYKYKEINEDEIRSNIKLYANKIYNILSKYEDFSISDFILYANLQNTFTKSALTDIFNWVTDNTIKLNLDFKSKNHVRFFSPVYSKLEMETRAFHLRLMNEYNNLDYGEYQKRSELLHKMFSNIGEYSEVVPPLQANWGGKNVHIGKGCYINFNCSMNDDGNIFIGDNVFIGPNVNICTVNHPVSPALRMRRLICIKDVHINDNVWIGAGAIILPGVTIGKNSVIGAGSVVTKDIPSDVLAYGNPCTIIKEIKEIK